MRHSRTVWSASGDLQFKRIEPIWRHNLISSNQAWHFRFPAEQRTWSNVAR
jgi:hypothetical protein